MSCVNLDYTESPERAILPDKPSSQPLVLNITRTLDFYLLCNFIYLVLINKP